MEYISEKLQDQNLMYKITTTNNGEEISFNVVCANNESEIEELIQVHLDYLNNPQPMVKQEQTQSIHETIKEQQALIIQLQADVAALKGVK
jgi:hypothetical protein